MPKPITATQLRANIYRVLDQVLETGQPQQVERGGETLLIVPAQRRRDLTAIPKEDLYVGTFDELVDTSWADTWKSEP